VNEAKILEILSGRRRDVSAQVLRGALQVASWAYGAAVMLRNKAYDRRWLATFSADAPVISLGNLTTGGTGKTPVAAWLAEWCQSRGLRPGLLSRGYRALNGDGDAVLNDEKLVLDRLCPAVPHLQQRDRIASARRLTGEFQCNVLILDDGFQHRRLRRDLDLVLIDALEPWGYEHLLPRGLLREPRSSLRRASLILLTRANECSEQTKTAIRQTLQRTRGTDECVEIGFVPQHLIGPAGVMEPLESVRGTRALAFCGIGNPGGFRQTLARLGCQTELNVYPDHYHYRPEDLAHLSQAARDQSAEVVLTTLKDLVKIPADQWTGPPLRAVGIGVEVLSGRERLEAALRQCVGNMATRATT